MGLNAKIDKENNTALSFPKPMLLKRKIITASLTPKPETDIGTATEKLETARQNILYVNVIFTPKLFKMK